MKFRPVLTVSLLIYIVVSSVAFAQVVDIPDADLRTAIADALNIPNDAPISQGDMIHLIDLDLFNRGVADLTGLESATNLISLTVSGSPITDFSSIAGLTQLEHLFMWGIPRADITPLANLTNLRSLDIAACDIVDISPLTRLTQLTNLNARYNQIVDISPLANLTNLVKLRLNSNRITDVASLAHLTRLDFLEIQHNRIVDHSPLDALALSHFTYDQTCEMSPLPLEPRLENRNYPSIFTRWGAPISNRPDLSYTENIAQHDLNFDVPQFKLKFREASDGITIVGILNEAA